VLRSAHQTAVALGATPLRREIELLAQRGRLRLEDHADTAQAPAMPSPMASLGLTRREAEVLALLAEGRTNRQIGQGAVHHREDGQPPRLPHPRQARRGRPRGGGRGGPPARPGPAMSVAHVRPSGSAWAAAPTSIQLYSGSYAAGMRNSAHRAVEGLPDHVVVGPELSGPVGYPDVSGPRPVLVETLAIAVGSGLPDQVTYVGVDGTR
jgi:hypothetical protein